jgi:hypothetical protein
MRVAIHHTANAYRIANLELANRIANGRHMPDDFMTGHTGINRPCPFRSDLMQVRMTNATISNVDLNVMCARIQFG